MVVCPADGSIVCHGDASLKARVEKAVGRLLTAMRPIPLLNQEL
jgi:hypothetical protein